MSRTTLTKLLATNARAQQLTRHDRELLTSFAKLSAEDRALVRAWIRVLQPVVPTAGGPRKPGARLMKAGELSTGGVR